MHMDSTEDAILTGERSDPHTSWPLRAGGLALAGAAIGAAYSLLAPDRSQRGGPDETARLFAATFLVVGGIAFAFTIDRVRAAWAFAFALAAGLLVAGVTYWNGPWSGWNSDEPWRFGCALLTVAIAAPFLQASRDRGRWSTDYAHLHGHAWSNVVIWFAAFAFTGVAFLLAYLLAALFALIGIDLLRDLLKEDWFGWTIAGGAFGAGVGLLRDNDRVVRLLQRVVVTVLSVLAPVLAAGLVLFLVALPFTGLAPLWQSTRSTTPILLTCIIGGLILANCIIGNGEAEEARAPILRWSGLALGAAILPLAIIAAVSTGSRVAQHGLSPDRIWALVFVAATSAYGAAYLLALVLRRRAWAAAVRPANVRLALGMLALVALLALPLANFGAVSARDQVSRLNAGKTKPEDFDFQAMRFDFGPVGVRALEGLTHHGKTENIRRLAREARSKRERTYGARRLSEESLTIRARTVRVVPVTVPLPLSLRDALFNELLGPAACDGKHPCTLFWKPGDIKAVAVGERCYGGDDCPVSTMLLKQESGVWKRRYGYDEDAAQTTAQRKAARHALSEALRRGEVEIRTVRRKQVFVGGQPTGDAFD